MGGETYTRGADATEGVFGRCTEVVQDLVELVDIAARYQNHSEYLSICAYALTPFP